MQSDSIFIKGSNWSGLILAAIQTMILGAEKSGSTSDSFSIEKGGEDSLKENSFARLPCWCTFRRSSYGLVSFYAVFHIKTVISWYKICVALNKEMGFALFRNADTMRMMAMLISFSVGQECWPVEFMFSTVEFIYHSYCNNQWEILPYQQRVLENVNSMKNAT